MKKENINEEFFLCPNIEDKELSDFFEKLKNENTVVLNDCGIPMKGDVFYLKNLKNKKASPEKIKEIAERLGL